MLNLNALLGNLGSITKSKSGTQSMISTREDLRVQDGDAAYDTEAEVYALITNTAYTYFKLIWQKTIPAQQMWHWGYGSAALPYNQGYGWFCAVDQGTGFAVGVVRLVQAKANFAREWRIKDIPDQSLHTTTSTTITTATPTLGAGLGGYPIPEQTAFPWIGEDSIIAIKYKLVTATTAIDASNFSLPVTVRQ